LKFIVGYDLEKFKEYYRTLADLHRFYSAHGTRKITESFEIGEDELNYITCDANHLIVWKDDETIIGHCIWHETTTDEMISGQPRDEDDKIIVQSLFNGARDNLVELHEVWLKTDFRGKGYGEQFFDFFERFVHESGFAGIIYYTDNPAAITTCRKRGYKEAIEPSELGGWYVFVKSI